MNIIIASGGTLGHLTPILPIVEVLSKEHNVYLLTSKDLEFKHKFKKIYRIEASGRTKNIFKFLMKNISANKKIKKIIKSIKPNLIIGMGGYISGLVIRLGIKFKIKTIIHEQNSILGLSNRLVAKKVNLLIHSYYDIDYKGHNKIYLPNPRTEVSSSKSRLIRKINKHILITSGTNGAKTINDISIKLAKELTNYHFSLITGKKYYNQYRTYESSNLKIIPYTTKLVDLICEADIVISRAGASTISEIIGTKTKAIYIPSPNVTNNHQYKNSLFIIKNKLGVVLLEKDLTINNLKESINDLETNHLIYIDNLNKINNSNIINRYINVINEVCYKDE